MLLMATSCDKFLEETPSSELTSSSFWRSEKDALTGTLAYYYSFSRAMASNYWSWGELRADNFIHGSSSGGEAQSELIENRFLNTHSACSWSGLYETIGRANLALKYIPNIDMASATRNRYLAEAYCMRALCYLYLIKVWGDVPVFTEPIESTDDGIYRKREDAVRIIYDVILADLAKAEYLMPTDIPIMTKGEFDSPKTRFTVIAIYAILMDTYAWLGGRYGQRIGYESLRDIYENKYRVAIGRLRPTFDFDFSASDDKWVDIFAERSIDQDADTQIWPRSSNYSVKEHIFTISYDKLTNGTNSSASYFINANHPLKISDSLLKVSRLDANDKRISAIHYVSGDVDKVYKWQRKPAASGVDSDADLIIYRTTEMELLYAEALNALDYRQEAVAIMNTIRQRAQGGSSADYYNASRYPTANDLVDDLLKERRLEFVAEGKRWFDLVRLNRWYQVMNPINGMTSGKHNMVFPIHRDHLLQNPELEQTPGYN